MIEIASASQLQGSLTQKFWGLGCNSLSSSLALLSWTQSMAANELTA